MFCMLNLGGIVTKSSRMRHSAVSRGDIEDHDVIHALVSPSQTEMHPQTLGPNYREL